MNVKAIEFAHIEVQVCIAVLENNSTEFSMPMDTSPASDQPLCKLLAINCYTIKE